MRTERKRGQACSEAKATMKLSKYAARGTIQSSGMDAMFSPRWLVTAQSSMEAQAGRSIQRSEVFDSGAAALFGIGGVAGLRRCCRASAPQSAAKMQKPASHTKACERKASFGSTMDG